MGAKRDPCKHKGNDEEAQVSRLTYAASHGDLKTIKLLASLGIDLGHADYDGRTALHVAASDGQHGVVAYLLNRGVEPSPTDRWGGTPLSNAEAGQHARATELLRAAVGAGDANGNANGHGNGAKPAAAGVPPPVVPVALSTPIQKKLAAGYYSAGETPKTPVRHILPSPGGTR